MITPYLFNHISGDGLTKYICTFPDGDPNDGIPIEEVVTVSLGLTVVYMFLATAGIVFAVACLLFTIIFRKKRYMHMYMHTLS